jgi:hypothetical protein
MTHSHRRRIGRITPPPEVEPLESRALLSRIVGEGVEPPVAQVGPVEAPPSPSPPGQVGTGDHTPDLGPVVRSEQETTESHVPEAPGRSAAAGLVPIDAASSDGEIRSVKGDDGLTSVSPTPQPSPGPSSDQVRAVLDGEESGKGRAPIFLDRVLPEPSSAAIPTGTAAPSSTPPDLVSANLSAGPLTGGTVNAVSQDHATTVDARHPETIAESVASSNPDPPSPARSESKPETATASVPSAPDSSGPIADTSTPTGPGLTTLGPREAARAGVAPGAASRFGAIAGLKVASRLGETPSPAAPARLSSRSSAVEPTSNERSTPASVPIPILSLGRATEIAATNTPADNPTRSSGLPSSPVATTAPTLARPAMAAGIAAVPVRTGPAAAAAPTVPPSTGRAAPAALPASPTGSPVPIAPSPPSAPPAPAGGTVGSALSKGEAALSGWLAQGTLPPPARGQTSIVRGVDRNSTAIRPAPPTAPAVGAADPDLARDLRDLLGQFRSLAVELHARLGTGDPSSWLLLAGTVSIAFGIVRRELRRSDDEPPAGGDPDLLTSWGMP